MRAPLFALLQRHVPSHATSSSAGIPARAIQPTSSCVIRSPLPPLSAERRFAFLHEISHLNFNNEHSSFPLIYRGVVIASRSYGVYIPYHVVECTPLRDLFPNEEETFLETFRLAVVSPREENVWFGYRIVMYNPCNADIDEVYVMVADFAPGTVEYVIKDTNAHIHYGDWIQYCVRSRRVEKK